eukprot:4511921-Pyramimonas_sp.AAC.1
MPVYTENGIDNHLGWASPPGTRATGVRGIGLVLGGRVTVSLHMRVCAHAATRMDSLGAGKTMSVPPSIEAGR